MNIFRTSNKQELIMKRYYLILTHHFKILVLLKGFLAFSKFITKASFRFS